MNLKGFHTCAGSTYSAQHSTAPARAAGTISGGLLMIEFNKRGLSDQSGAEQYTSAHQEYHDAQGPTDPRCCPCFVAGNANHTQGVPQTVALTMSTHCVCPLSHGVTVSCVTPCSVQAAHCLITLKIQH